MALVTVQKEVLTEGLKKYFEGDKLAEMYHGIVDDGFQFSDLQRIYFLVKEAVIIVEKLVADMGEVGAGAGAVKKEAVVKFIDDSLKFNFFIEMFDDNIASALVDAVVAWFNVWHGKTWIQEFIGKYI